MSKHVETSIRIYKLIVLGFPFIHRVNKHSLTQYLSSSHSPSSTETEEVEAEEAETSGTGTRAGVGVFKAGVV